MGKVSGCVYARVEQVRSLIHSLDLRIKSVFGGDTEAIGVPGKPPPTHELALILGSVKLVV